MAESGRTGGPVVVGIDGSEHAQAALRYAVEEGARRGVAVEAVAAVEPPEVWAYAYGVSLLPDVDERRRVAAEEAQRWVGDIRADLPAVMRAVPVTVSARTGSPTAVLVEASAEAALLVVGHRGRGAVRSTLLGSVGLGCVLHAACPVTVVPVRPATGAPVEEASVPASRPGATTAGSRV